MVEKFTLPQITIKDLIGAIPKECFQRSAIKSSRYVLQNVLLSGLLIKGSVYIPYLTQLSGGYYTSSVVSSALWSFFWFAQGLSFTGLWVLAHECGHYAYSNRKYINNMVGFILHSILLVPYYSWKISHAKHHAGIGHMNKDQVFVPQTRSETRALTLDYENADENVVTGVDVPEEEQLRLSEVLEDAPLVVLLNLLIQQLVGWPLYLLMNVSGQRYPKWTSHFNPYAAIFDTRHFGQVVLSDVGIAGVLLGLFVWGQQRGFREVVFHYLIPYLWVNCWLVSVTFLQHTDPSVPRYRDGLWNFQRGALCTIDRVFMGPVGTYILHGICETHIAHHVCSKIPHYNAWKATDALKTYLGPHYNYSDENFFVSLYKTYRDCVFVEDQGDIVFYKDSRGRASRMAELKQTQEVSDSGVELQ
ncbi:hypothetical protein E3P92_03562 [Wallemia ichthyophaga]|uniref:Fatty acid desaturase domain-containing protein n=2 Tax=Wallemia ichthyophaga TaxID=245174 RepID=A0A4T0EVX7_WALIC|nr:Delta(12) fatty acid desaturase [Wallemia ichthyophaga EXF-994]TIA78967.1 hypothetical protein E3P98_03568 [Wallemia ichthyophaga]EOQ98848.1 Delta(12) fatty acid desaturase [Wallemia ichthyophaga EXF-994]TIA95909.1 hypothetical protein E3P95_03498 [Wallemia ichthyophaga]TIA96928.1 hypothetical protein E3P94_03505 [Wallemia ichthyophaga]TIB09181.1 hypothetical protein E3P92_03562 [Wallemia ichthyophaga]